jgi:prolyl oligopeptidase
MKRTPYILILFAFLLIAGCEQKVAIKYPVTKKDNVTDIYFGVKIADPYRWLENDTSKETSDWVKAQNVLTVDYLSKIPYRKKIQERLTKIWNFPKYRVPFSHGPYYFFFKNDGLQNQFVLYFRKGLNGEPKVLLDPNKLSEDGSVALASYEVSNDGKYLVYNVSKSGSDINDVRVIEVETQVVLNDHVRGVKISSIYWKEGGFYYSRYPDHNPGQESGGKSEYQKVWYHKLGTDSKSDVLVYENMEFPQRGYQAAVTDDERFLLIYEYESVNGNALYFKDFSEKDVRKFKPLAAGFENQYNVVDNIGDKLLVITSYHAAKKKLILMDPEKPQPENWKTIIPERDDVLEDVVLAGDKIISLYEQNAVSKAFVYDLNGKFVDEIALPGLGKITGVSGHKGDNVAFFGYTTFRFPVTVFKYDPSVNQATVYTRPEIDFDPELYEAKQIQYLGRDRTTITMFLVYKKGIKLDGKNPTMMFGYGGFNYSMTPSFAISRTVFLENGGIFAVPNLRGGGEYGEEWHKAGMRERKQNTFDDFIAAAEYLISEGYTSPDKLGIMGTANGGLLVGACMTQRPDLFKVAIPQSAVMDMLRYHIFTIGWAWKPEYGTSETENGFNILIRYSPLQNLKKGVSYPATLALTSEHDDRVVPSHSYKFISTLQEDNAGPNPVLIRVDTKGFLRGGTPTSRAIEENTDLWSFVFYNLGMKLK